MVSLWASFIPFGRSPRPSMTIPTDPTTSNAGGGGERVLWAAIRATQIKYPESLCVVYAGDCGNVTKAQIVDKVKERFAITLEAERLYFVHLTQIRLVQAQLYPHFTLLGQSLGSLVLALDAFHGLVPDVFIDTMGYGFTLPLAKLLFPGIPVGAYVHYPTISTDMLGAIPENAGFKMTVKRLYWRAFAGVYSLCGKGVDVIMANSSWTAGHIRALWAGGDPKRVSVVFPPCAVEEVQQAVRIDTPRQKSILCIAQFRPEKKHDLIIEAFSKFIKSGTEASRDARLVLVGSVRHSEDAMRVYDLRLLTIELGLREVVDFVLDSSWDEVLGWLGRCSVGTNAMWNEHFGIGVVEYQAAGLVSVVHASGGPKLDIVIDYEGGPTGKSLVCVLDS